MLTLGDLRQLLVRLDGEPADALEDQTLEFKSWSRHGSAYKSQLRELRESVVAFANAEGGLIVLGVSDGRKTRSDAIHGVSRLAEDSLRRDIYDGTDPHILTEVESLLEPEGRLVVIRVPRGLPPHTTTDGVGKVRVGKDSKPLTGSSIAQLLVTRGRYDLSAEVIPGVTPADLDPLEINRISQYATDGGARELGALGNDAILEALGLISGSDVTLAAVLLAGTQTILSRYAPRHELILTRQEDSTRYDFRRDLRGPLLQIVDEVQRLLDANLRLSTVDVSGFQQIEFPDISWWVAREAVLNALTHRDYFLNQSIHVRLLQGRIEVESPGGLIGGITVNNILRHPPVRRNPLLADVLQTIGLVNRAGLGVDRIYEESLLAGKDLPRYEADESHVKLVLPTRTHADFARFVLGVRRGSDRLSLDDLIAMRGLVRRRSLDRWSARDLLQNSEEEVAACLASLRERGYLVAQGRGRGTVYRLARRYSSLIDDEVVPGEDIWLDDESVRLRVLSLLTERGRITNAEVRKISGYSRTQVVKVMRSLRQEGLVRVIGRGRAAHYVSSSGGGELGIEDC